ncbi:MAG: response regulator [Coleofasciculaceae cyanobacterium SM2_1_6]|nr:response regulator [Coleofasciculaceae cyanobacterium SM2_1_6]
MAKVLIVEDSLTQRELIAQLLKENGLEVYTAADGLEAIERIQRDPPDLVILDIILPKMNGYEICRKIKADVRTQNLAVIMCSAKKEEFDRYWGMKQGADAYISKPFLPQELVGTIKQLLLK